MNRAQWIYDRLAAGAPGRKIRGGRLLRWARRRLVASQNDPLVEFSFDGIRIEIPLSHDVGLHWNRHPDYGRNLARLGAAVRQKYPGMAAIDIGANVGDSIAMMRTRARFPVLAVEGNEKYAARLRANAARLGDVEVCVTLLDARPTERRGTLQENSGTAVVQAVTEGGERMSFQTLESVLEGRSRFAATKLVKVDTDGFDGLILRGAAAWLARAQPVLFFEFDPHTWTLQGDSGAGLFETLGQAGYSGTLVYDNFGKLLDSFQAGNQGKVAGLLKQFANRKSEYFADVAVFAQADEDLFADFLKSEQDYFARLGPTPASPP